jgi:hypothetical protein
MSEPDPHRKVAQLAADLYELVDKLSDKRRLLLPEIIMANLIATANWTQNCECSGCKCGNNSHEEASRELTGGIGDAAIKDVWTRDRSAPLIRFLQQIGT